MIDHCSCLELKEVHPPIVDKNSTLLEIPSTSALSTNLCEGTDTEASQPLNCTEKTTYITDTKQYNKDKVIYEVPIVREKGLFETLMDTLAFSETKSRRKVSTTLSPTSTIHPTTVTMEDVVVCMAFPEQHCVSDGKIYEQALSESVSEGRVVVWDDRIERMEFIGQKEKPETTLHEDQETTFDKILHHLGSPEANCVRP